MSGVAQDLRYAARLLWRQPRYTFLIVLTMALGIGATTALFSVTYGVLMRPLPWPNADRLVVLRETRGGRAPRFGAFSNAAAIALYFMYYNFGRIHQTLRVTPALEAGIANHVWSVEEIVGLLG